MERINDRQEKAIAALLTSPTRKAAAKKAGISERAMYNYMQDADFVERYQAECDLLVSDAARQAQQAVNRALETLEEVMNDRTAQPYARISASRSILEYSLKLAERCEKVRKEREVEPWEIIK